MMNPDKITVEDLLSDESFINYCRGNSQKDTVFWENYISLNPCMELEIKHAKEEYFQLFNALAQADMEEQLERLKKNLEQRKTAPVVPINKFEKRGRTSVVPLLLKIAVAAMFITGLFFTINYFINTPEKTDKYFETAYGEKKNIQLPDGTNVTMNAGSKIRIKDKYGIGTRDIYLEGEAFFEVKHDSIHPFVVHTAAMDVKALGTSFNVKAYREDGTTETSLITGIIEVTLKQNNNSRLLLYPNQKIAWQRHKERIVNINTNQAPKTEGVAAMDNLTGSQEGLSPADIKEISWKENKLVFDDEEFGNIAKLLERWYGAKITFSDNSLLKYRFTGIFENEDLTKVLDFLKESKNFNYTIERGETLKLTLSR
jgi:ferric-dicitrate binding protein FerR (iron transport regulator)